MEDPEDEPRSMLEDFMKMMASGHHNRRAYIYIAGLIDRGVAEHKRILDDECVRP